MYVIRDFDPGNPKQGFVVVQGSSSTVNLVSVLPRFEEEGLNVKVISAISDELFHRQPEAYKNSVLPPEARYDMMVVSTGTRRIAPLEYSGPLTDEYSLVSDWDDQWLTGGNEADVIAEARLDPESIFQGVKRFAVDHDSRIARQAAQLDSLR
jgi:transketolase